MSDDIINRLDRFENKLDKLADAVLTIARVEERQSQHSRTLERVWTEVAAVRDDATDLKARVGEIETKQAQARVNMSWIERIAWTVITVGAASISIIGG